MENLLVKLHREIADRQHRKLASAFSKGSDMDLSILSGDAPQIDLFASYEESECETVDLKSGMVELVSVLRALYWLLQHAHWQCAGDNFYGNHLLFERIYEDISVEVDQAAEKAVGYFGPEVLSSAQVMSSALDWVAKWEEEAETFLSRTLLAFEDVQEFLNDLYEDCDDLPMGLDDMLQSFAGKHDEHLFLLRSAQPENGKVASVIKTATATQIRANDLWSLAGLSVVSAEDNTLINTATQDFWAVKMGDDGHPYIERLLDTDIV